MRREDSMLSYFGGARKRIVYLAAAAIALFLLLHFLWGGKPRTERQQQDDFSTDGRGAGLSLAQKTSLETEVAILKGLVDQLLESSVSSMGTKEDDLAGSSSALLASVQRNIRELRKESRIMQQQIGKLYCDRYKLGPTGGWCLTEKTRIYYDHGLATALITLFKDKMIHDFGARTGTYAKTLISSCEVPLVKGWDAAPNVEDFTKGFVEFGDLSVYQEWPRLDWVMSLEVAEHIPPQFEDVYLGNIDRHNREGAVISWAVPGQGGQSHVNLRSSEYVRAKFDSMGYESDHEMEKVLHDASDLPQFKHVMVFRRKKPIGQPTEDVPLEFHRFDRMAKEYCQAAKEGHSMALSKTYEGKPGL